MDRATADQVSLRFHMAFEAIRQGRADGPSLQCMAQVALLTSFITDAGYGQLDEAVLAACEDGLRRLVNTAPAHDELKFDEDLLSNLALVINEHDRQLREVRLQVLVEASELLEKRLATAASARDLFSSRRRSLF